MCVLYVLLEALVDVFYNDYMFDAIVLSLKSIGSLCLIPLDI